MNTVKVEHWKTRHKRLKEEALARGEEFVEATPTEEELQEPKPTEVSAQEEVKKVSGKTEWSVVVGETVIHTYKLSDCEDAHERAIKLAAKKDGVVI